VEQAKKQKLLIAILAVAGLGAGYYYVFVRESGDTQAAVAGPSTGRKERKKTEETAKKETRRDKPQETAAAAPQPTGRKERTERPEAEASGRKTRGKANTEINKKKKIVPAA
jgi:uncharacterized protein HemX